MSTLSLENSSGASRSRNPRLPDLLHRLGFVLRNSSLKIYGLVIGRIWFRFRKKKWRSFQLTQSMTVVGDVTVGQSYWKINTGEFRSDEIDGGIYKIGGYKLKGRDIWNIRAVKNSGFFGRSIRRGAFGTS